MIMLFNCSIIINFNESYGIDSIDKIYFINASLPNLTNISYLGPKENIIE